MGASDFELNEGKNKFVSSKLSQLMHGKCQF